MCIVIVKQPLTSGILKLSWELLDWPDAAVLFFAHAVGAGQMGAGERRRVAQEVPVTPFPAPSAAATTCHTYDCASSSTLTEAHLPSSFLTERDLQQPMLNSLSHWPIEAWTNPLFTTGGLLVHEGSDCCKRRNKHGYSSRKKRTYTKNANDNFSPAFLESVSEMNKLITLFERMTQMTRWCLPTGRNIWRKW